MIFAKIRRLNCLFKRFGFAGLPVRIYVLIFLLAVGVSPVTLSAQDAVSQPSPHPALNNFSIISGSPPFLDISSVKAKALLASPVTPSAAVAPGVLSGEAKNFELVDAENQFSSEETPRFVIKRHFSLLKKLENHLLLNLAGYTSQELNSDVNFSVVNARGHSVEGFTVSAEKPDQLVISATDEVASGPGRYTLTVNLEGKEITQDFYWGVLALNSNRSIYLPGETAGLVFAVLDDRGDPVCDADLRLTVITPSGREDTLTTADSSIRTNGVCDQKAYTLIPDYKAEYPVQEEGFYRLRLEAETSNGLFSLTDHFEVRPAVDFEIERIAPTRVFPIEAYPVTLRIKSNRNYQGSVIEAVPAGIVVLPDTTFSHKDGRVIWEVNWQAGETYELSYFFDAPDQSPSFYTLGPLEIGDFAEIRTWQLAIDAVTRFYLPSSGTAPISPAYSSFWDGSQQSGAADSFARMPLVTTKSSTAMTTFSENGNTDTGDTNYIYGQWVSEPLAAQTISAQTFKVQVRGMEESSLANQYLALSVRVLSGDGSTVRGTIIQGRGDTEFDASTTILENRGGSATTTEVIANAGDRLVIEIGTGGNPSSGDGGDSHDADLSFGDDNATDLGENNTDTAAYNPWFQFANDILFLQAAPTVELDSPEDTGTINDPTPDLKFTGADEDENEMEYQIQINDSVSFSSEIENLLVNQNFEGTGFDNDETWISYGGSAGGAADPDYTTNPLLGEQSLRMKDDASEGTFAVTKYVSDDSGLNTIYGFFRFRISDLPSATNEIMQTYYVAGPVTSPSYLEPHESIYISSTGKLWVFFGGGGGGNEVEGPTQLSLDTDYYIWWYVNRTTANDGSGWIKVSTTPTMPEENYLSWSDKVQYGSYPAISNALGFTTLHGGGYEYIVDQVFVKESAIGSIPESSALIDVISDEDESGAFSGSGDPHPWPSGNLVTYTVQDALEEGTYYWRVRARCPEGSDTWGDWSDPWSFTLSSLTGITVSGIVYGTDETSAVTGENLTVKLVNSSNIGVGYTAVTDTNGAFSIGIGATATNSDILTLWLDGEDADGSLVLNYGASCSDYPNCTGLSLFEDRVILRDENSESITNAMLADCDNNTGSVCSDAEIGFESSSDNITLSDGFELHIWDGDTYAPGGNVTTSPAADQTSADGDIHIEGTATFIAGGAISCGGDWINEGTFTHSNQTVTFTGTDSDPDFGITDGAENFYDVVFNGTGGEWEFADSATVENDLTVTAGTLHETGSDTITVAGSVSGAGIISLAAGTFEQRIDGTTEIFGTSSGSTAWVFNNLVFSNSNISTGAIIDTATGGSGSITVNGNLLVSKTGDSQSTTLQAGNRTWILANNNGDKPFNLDQASGALTAESSVFQYTGDSDLGSVTIENATYTQVEFGGSVAETYVLENSIVATGNLTINTNATLDTVPGSNYGITVGGNWSNNGAFVANSGTVILDTATAVNLDSGCVDPSDCPNQDFHNLILDKSSAGSIVSLINNHLVVNTLTITTGTLSQGALNFRGVGATAVSVGIGGTWSNVSNGDIALGGSVINAGLVRLRGNNSCPSTDDIAISAISGTPSWDGAGSYEIYDVSLANQNAAVSISTYSSTNAGSNTGSWYYYPGCDNGTLATNIVDSLGVSVDSPAYPLSNKMFAFIYQSTNGSLGDSDQRIRVSNTTANPQWNLTLAASSGPTAYWDATAYYYDYNDPSPEGGDGSDDDSLGGQLAIDPSLATIIPQDGCSAVGLVKGSSTAFDEETEVNSITLLTAGETAELGCYWDLFDVDLLQTIPALQSAGAYSLNMVLTVTAY